MDNQIQGVIESRNGGDDTDRLSDREGPPINARRRQPQRNFSAGHDAQLVGGIAHAVDGAIGFDQSIGQRLAALARDLTSEMLTLALHQYCKLPEDLDTLMRFQPCIRISEEPSGGFDLVIERRGVVAFKSGNGRAIESLNDINHDCPQFPDP